jgi:acyl-CoA thioesterase I
MRMGLALALAALAFGGAGCKDSDDGGDSPATEEQVPEEEAPAEGGDASPEGSGEEAEDEPKQIVAWGDSLTAGSALPEAKPYPERLAEMKGEPVANGGIGGQSACRGVNRFDWILPHNPKMVLLLFGTNDVLSEHNLDNSKECLRIMIRRTKEIGAVPVIGTIPPMVGEKERLNGLVGEMNVRIRAVAAEEGIRLVDVAADFGNGEGLMLDDGFHPNDAGTEVIAVAFASAI